MSNKGERFVDFAGTNDPVWEEKEGWEGRVAERMAAIQNLGCPRAAAGMIAGEEEGMRELVKTARQFVEDPKYLRRRVERYFKSGEMSGGSPESETAAVFSAKDKHAKRKQSLGAEYKGDFRPNMEYAVDVEKLAVKLYERGELIREIPVVSLLYPNMPDARDLVSSVKGSRAYDFETSEELGKRLQLVPGNPHVPKSLVSEAYLDFLMGQEQRIQKLLGPSFHALSEVVYFDRKAGDGIGRIEKGWKLEAITSDRVFISKTGLQRCLVVPIKNFVEGQL